MNKDKTKGKLKSCPHPGEYHLGSDGLSIVKPHPQADTCFARSQGYVIAKIEPAYASLATRMVAALNRTTSARDVQRSALRAIGCHLDSSDESTDWFTVPAASEARLYEIRDSLPFWMLYCHEKAGGLVVYYDRPCND